MPDPSRLTTPDAILRASLQKETQARDFYQALAARCSVGFVKELLLTLQNEESKHIRMIRDMMDRVGSGRSPKATDG